MTDKPMSNATVFKNNDGSRHICDKGLHQVHLVEGLSGSVDFSRLHAALKGVPTDNVLIDPSIKGPNQEECLRVTPDRKGNKYSNPLLR